MATSSPSAASCGAEPSLSRSKRLGAAGDRDGAHAALQPLVGVQHPLDLGLGLVDRLRVARHPRLDVRRQLVVLLGEEVLEREVGELGLEVPHAETAGERREDLERLARDRDALLMRHKLKRAHVVQPVGQLDHHDAPVVRHGDEHRAQVLNLLVGGAGAAQRALAADVEARAHHFGQLRHLGLALDDLAH
eukprot:603196-Pleurochrysis_carterae.AAC.1